MPEPEGPPPRDWSAALTLVERAALTIADYESKFVAIETDTRAFIRRVKEEQLRSARRLADLDEKLAEAERRAEIAEAALTTATTRIADLEAERDSQRLKLEETEAERLRPRSGPRAVEDLLGGL